MLILTVGSLLAVAVFALRGDQTRLRYTEIEDRDVEFYCAGQTYKYRLDTQIASGIATVSNQHAVTRLQAEAQLHFKSDRLVALKLKDVTISTTNQDIENPEQIQPIQIFKETEIKTDDIRLLELPCEFDYTDGLIELVRFNPHDKSWSKNIKKSVLNMLQINLKQRKGMGVQLEQPKSWETEREQQDLLTKHTNYIQSRMFVMPEITLEGECQVAYVLNPVTRSKSQDSDIKPMLNVTKTVDYHNCNKIADIYYGSKIEKPCKNCTTQQELVERKLDRTTVIHQVVVGTPEKYCIKKVETVSHYIFKTLNIEEESPMRTVVVCQLNLVRVENDRSWIESELKTDSKPESLLYSIEYDIKEKFFYMFGDEEFPQETPFDKVQDKVGKVKNILKKLVSLWADKVKGIDNEAPLVYNRLVELLRMCTQTELEKICSFAKDLNTETEGPNCVEILIDALANAGTFNTIKVLAKRIENGNVQPGCTTRAILQLKDLPAPSEKQIKVLIDLCESNICKENESCHQVCWLTVGNLVGKLCDDELTIDDAVEMLKPQCHKQLKTDFVSKIMGAFETFQTRYKKIVILKALGNAGLERSVVDLEKIIHKLHEDPLVRMQAIDSLRRLRAVMPIKIQRILLPIFQNVRERPEVRMMAASQILATFPERPVLDQICFTLLREPSRQVKSYIYKAMKELSKSPIEAEIEVAQHLKSCLKLADITEEEEETLVRGSRYYRIPVYSQNNKEGLFFDLESMFGPDNFLPKHLSAGMDTLFNGLFQKNIIEISLTQENVEQWFEKLLNVYVDYSSLSSRNSQLRARRRTSSSEESRESNDQFSKIINDLGIKHRRVDSDSDNRNNAPYAMLNLRYKDMDYAVLPLEEEFLPHSLKKIITHNRKPSINDIKELIQAIRRSKFSYQVATNLVDCSIKIPTTAGLPLLMRNVVPLLASLQGNSQAELRSEDDALVFHPTVSITHLKRIEVWSPIIHTGVDSTRTASINLPLNAKLACTEEGVKLTINVPEQKCRILDIHTLPLTYVTEQEWIQPRNPLVKRIENQNLVHRSVHFNKTCGKHNLGMPFQLSGEVHLPHCCHCYREIAVALLSTENHLHVEFVPEEETPRQIVVLGEGRFFQTSSESLTSHRELQKFHSESRFDTEMDSYYGDEGKGERQFNKFLDEYEPTKLYKHCINFEVKTVGGRKEKHAQIEIEVNTDSQNRYWKAQLKAKRSALPSLEESRPWTIHADAQIVFPEICSTIQQCANQDAEKQQHLVARINTKWGCDQIQTVRMHINGKQGRNPEWRQKIREIERFNNPDAKKLCKEMIQKAAFLNKYDISAECENLTPQTQCALNTLTTLLKSWNFWQTKVESKQIGQNPRSWNNGHVTATIVIDPVTHEHVNVTLKTPVEIIRVESLTLPCPVKPFKLLKPGKIQQSIDSFSEMIRDYAVENRQECKLTQHKIQTFDGVVYKAPLTKCYSVLAKDCGNKNPRFAVLVKKLQDQEKALKVITRGNVIEVQPEQRKLIVLINGKHETNEDTLQEYGIDCTKDIVRIANKDLTVRFDGKEVSVKIASTHKNTQCGLCGHYDDDTENEFRMGNNELTSDLKNYHKSYSLVDDECREDFVETHRQEEYKQLKERYNNYDYDDDKFEQSRRQRKNDNNEIDPVEKTETLEYNHKICFSVKPVKTCPEESYPGKTKEMKVGFLCLDRTSSEARRLLKEAQLSDSFIRLPLNKPSFVVTITVPSTCEVY